MEIPVRTRAFALAVLAMLLYLPALSGGFLEWDDRALVLENRVAALPPVSAAREAFAHPVGTTWWPLRELSYALDHAVWDFRPQGFHLTNVLLYALTCVGFYLGARRFLGEGPGFLAALLFTAHPLHAEPVAWISGRKEVLCGLFLVLAWGSLMGEGRRRYLLGLLFYAAACLSKTAALPFPLVWWLQDRKRSWKALAPFLLVMGVLSAVQWRLAAGAGVSGTYESLKPALMTPLLSVLDQAGALVLPLGLSPAYPVDLGSPDALRLLGWALAALGSWAALRRPEARFGLAWALLFLLPVINLGVATSTPRADRYAFLPSMGACLAAGCLLKRRRAVALALAFSALAWVRGGTWVDDLHLWRPAVRRHPDSFVAAGGLGWGQVRAGRIGPARQALERMARIDPSSPLAHHQLGGLFRSLGERERALLEYGEANRLYAEMAKGREGVRVASGYGAERIQCLLELGEVVLSLGDPGSAARHAQAAVDLDPSAARSWAYLGLWRAEAGDLPGGIQACDQALALSPGLPEAHWHRARLAQRMGETIFLTSTAGEAWKPAARAAFERAAAECRWILLANPPSPERADVLSRLAFAEIRLGNLADSPVEAARRRARAERIYADMLPGTQSEADRRNLSGLWRIKAAEHAARGEWAYALEAAEGASQLQPEDRDLHRMAAELARLSGHPEKAAPHELRLAEPE